MSAHTPYGDGVTPTRMLTPQSCEDCGHALEIRCSNARCGNPPEARTYREKNCVTCGLLFEPTGPRAAYCGSCVSRSHSRAST